MTVKIFDTDRDHLHLVFEKEPKTGLTIWAVFDTNTKTFTASGCSHRWDDAAAEAREAMKGVRHEATNS
jgi:hypothetical protein